MSSGWDMHNGVTRRFGPRLSSAGFVGDGKCNPRSSWVRIDVREQLQRVLVHYLTLRRCAAYLDRCAQPLAHFSLVVVRNKPNGQCGRLETKTCVQRNGT
nr:hypothetical protein CFP56_10329 [Quercus suber]